MKEENNLEMACSLLHFIQEGVLGERYILQRFDLHLSNNNSEKRCIKYVEIGEVPRDEHVKVQRLLADLCTPRSSCSRVQLNIILNSHLMLVYEAPGRPCETFPRVLGEHRKLPGVVLQVQPESVRTIRMFTSKNK